VFSSRREFLAASLPVAALASGQNTLAERFGVMCNLETNEVSARKVLGSARQAGFRRIQLKFPWTKVNSAYLNALPTWVRSEGLKTEALGAYVNCCAPQVVLMDARPEDLPRAIELAANLDCRCLVAWTGGYSANMAMPDTRNWRPEAEDAICRFVFPHISALESSGLVLALESYITLACPDAASLRRVLDRLPACFGAVMDPPNLTPVRRYAQRDQVLREIFAILRERTYIVHMKDFRMNATRDGYVLPGPLEGEMNYRLFLQEVLTLPVGTPLIAEHLDAAHFADTRSRLLDMSRSLTH
jgi:sugar phosphate isomerase/epimerase